MSTNVILLRRNPKDEPKYKALIGLNPTDISTYEQANVVPSPLAFEGTADYMLVTGGHGDFIAGMPTKFNDLKAPVARQWIAKLTGSYRAIVLDTCFSSGFAIPFIGFLPMGGCIVCAHGSGEGWAGGFNAENGKKTVGEVLSDVVTNSEGMGLGFSSISLLVRRMTGLVLYTANAGAARGEGLSTRGMYGMDCDTAEELAQLDQYLLKNLVFIEHLSNLDLKLRLQSHLKMTVI